MDAFDPGRRRFLAATTALTVAPLVGCSWSSVRAAAGPLVLGRSAPHDFPALRERARRLAQRSHRPEAGVAPSLLEQIDFDAYQAIRFRSEYSLCGDGSAPFPVQFFHLGRYHKVPVRIFEVADGEAREIRYAPEAFDYGDTGFGETLPRDELGWAGFRVMAPDGETDWLAFLGASYFRSSGELDQYGLSARGIAVDTGRAGVSEEFPRFSELWLHRPRPGAEGLVIDALLEGESLTGAYRFNVTRGRAVVTSVHAELFVRRTIARFGVAPLTSMYWYSETNHRIATDWRPEIHDSDGLAIWTGEGERIWRPLNNPDRMRLSAFADEDVRGFGLLQRDRAFHNYQDDGVWYNRRPSAWIEPHGDWGEGAVQLLEIPTDDEIDDNIVSFWVPARPAEAGTEWVFDYDLHWVAEEPYPPESVGRTVATRTGQGGVPGQPRPEGRTKFVIDFEGGALDDLEQRYDVETVVEASRGRVDNTWALKVVGTRRWRGSFDLEVEGEEAVELRCHLRLDGKVLTETWLYQHLPAGRSLAARAARPYNHEVTG